MRYLKYFPLLLLFLFSASQVFPQDTLFSAAVNYDVGLTPWTICHADLDGDGDKDLVTANLDSDDISILLNNGDGTFQAAIDYDAGEYTSAVCSKDSCADQRTPCSPGIPGPVDTKCLQGRQHSSSSWLPES